MLLCLVPLLRPAAPLLVVQLAQLETAGGHLLVAITLSLMLVVLVGTEVLVCLRCVRLRVVATVVAVVTLVAVAVVVMTEVGAVALTHSGPRVRVSRPVLERVVGETKSLTRLSARSSRP